MPFSTDGLARASTQHPWRIVGVWIAAVLVSFGLVGGLLGGVLTSEAELTNDPESYRAYQLIGERIPADPDFATEVVIVRVGETATTPAGAPLTTEASSFQATLRRIKRELETIEGVVVVGAPAAVSLDHRAALLTLRMEHDPEGTIPEVVERVGSFDEAPFEVEITGEWTADEDFGRLSEQDLQEGELFYGLPASLVILLVVFGTVVAGLLPLLMAIVSIVVALALTALVGQVWELSIFVVNMLTGMGLALGIDYTLCSRVSARNAATDSKRRRRSRLRVRRQAAPSSSAASRSCSR